MASFDPPPTFRDVMTELPDGQLAMDPAWARWFIQLAGAFTAGYTGSVTLAKITGGGTNGSLTVVNGLIVSVVAPT